MFLRTKKTHITSCTMWWFLFSSFKYSLSSLIINHDQNQSRNGNESCGKARQNASESDLGSQRGHRWRQHNCLWFDYSNHSDVGIWFDNDKNLKMPLRQFLSLYITDMYLARLLNVRQLYKAVCYKLPEAKAMSLNCLNCFKVQNPTIFSLLS